MSRVLSKVASTASVRFVAQALVAMLALNANGVLSMIFDVERLASVLILLCTIWLLMTVRSKLLFHPRLAGLFALSIGLYLVIGWLSHREYSTVFEPPKYLITYASTVLIVVSLSRFVSSIENRRSLDAFLRYSRNIFVIAAASVWASPWLYEIYRNLPATYTQRMSGFFGNPNEAAIASTLAVAFILIVPYRSRILNILLVALCAGAVLLTFSKTGMMLLIIAPIWPLARRPRLIVFAVIPLSLLLLGTSGDWDLNSAVDRALQNPSLHLDQTQQTRIRVVFAVLSGEIDDASTTGRTYLWGFALPRLLDNLPFGSGLGSYHHLIGGMMEDETWQGIHNTFLMILGESGVIPTIFIIVFSALLAARIARTSGLVSNLSFLFATLLADMMVSHATLGTRYHNCALAILLGLLANPHFREEVGFRRKLIFSRTAGRRAAFTTVTV